METLTTLVFLLAVTINSGHGFSYQRTFRETQICGLHNGHRKYMELGDTGVLSANNITVPIYLQEASGKFNQSLTFQCTLELVTCPSCVINVKFNYNNFLSNCEYPTSGGNACRCDHIVIGEPPYDQKENLVYNCGSMMEYKTKSRSVQVKFVYWNNYTDAFQLEYSVERNRETIDLGENETAIISSPFFPSPYPRDHSLEQVVTCSDENCRIYVVFSDFQLARASSMEFFDSDGERLFITGAMFRPPILITTGPSLMIRFYANGASDLGYKATVTFLTLEKSRDSELKVRNGCGGLVESVGGAITMMNMLNTVDNETEEPLRYDCIWIIRPPLGYVHLKTHISLKVETFENMESPSEITILQGTTSERPLLERLESSAVKSVSSRTFVIPITSGYYVRLRGKFNSLSRIAITYTAFSYSKCYIGGEFLCDNRRCIPIMLQCDGFNQCGDNSDEPEKCPTEWANSIIDRRWYSHTPNYYFPKVDRFPDLKATTLAFVVSSMSLLFVISCLIVTLYRNGNRSREREELQNQLHTISQLLDSNNNLRPEEDTEPPPNYEATGLPPSYDEIIKVGMDDQLNKIKRDRRSGRRSRLQRPRRSDPAVSYQSGLLSLEEGETASVSSSSTFPSPNHSVRPEAFLPSLHMLDITETCETEVKAKTQDSKTTGTLLNPNSITTSFSDTQSLPCSSNIANRNPSNDSPTPQHLWSNESKFRKSWIVFNSDEHLATMQPADSIDESVNYSQRPSFTYDNETSLTSMDSCFCDAAKSIYSEKFKTSLFISQLECERCKNLLLRHENRRSSICPDCIEKIYSPKTCATCSGRISFQDLKDTNVLQTVNRKFFNEHMEPLSLKLCNCYPRPFTKQLSLDQLDDNREHVDIPQIIVKSFSCDDMAAGQSNQSFYSDLLNKNTSVEFLKDSE